MYSFGFPGCLRGGLEGLCVSVGCSVRVGDATEHHKVTNGIAADAVAAVHAAGGLARGEFFRYLVIVLFDPLARCEKGQKPVVFTVLEIIIDPLVSLILSGQSVFCES